MVRFQLSLLLANAAFSAALPAHQNARDTCSPQRTGTDVTAPQRSSKYPNGLSGTTVDECCAACNGAPDCIAWVWTQPSPGDCFPLANYATLIPATDRVFGGGPPPPPPPPPASWAPKIAAADMLYSPTDAGVDPTQMPMVGNGFLATQVMSGSLWVAGIFNGYLTSDPSHRARVPATNAVAAPGIPGPAALDVREATYIRRSYLDPAPPGACTNASTASCSNAPDRLWIEQRWYAHRAIPSVLVMEVQVLQGGDNETAAVAGPHSGDFSTAAGGGDAPPLAMLKLSNNPGGDSSDLNLTSVPVDKDSTYSIAVGWTRVAETNSSGLQGVAVLTTDLPPGGMLAVAADAPYATAFFLTVVRTTVETDAALLVAAVGTDFATATAQAQAGTLHASHVAEWAATVWPAGFETDRLDVAAAVNSSLYAILSSVRNDRNFGLSPGGLTDGYNGHSFWDCETWMFPGVNLLHPDTANSLLAYRVNRLSGAHEKALSYTPPFGGAMFPWESAYTGVETCPTWAATGLREIHISGDIAFAVWQFWRATQDNSGGWLNTTAWPLLEGIAQFWMSKLALDNPGAPASAPLSLNDVIPPDEYADHANNSAYTNSVAIYSLQYASAVGALLGQDPAVYAPWVDAAGRIVVPFNATSPPNVTAGGWHPEYDGYPVGRQIKQADTILLGFPLEVPFASMTPTVRANDLAYYSTVTDAGGPAMTWGMFSIAYVELGAGYEALAASNFNRSFANAQPPFLVWTETPSGGTPNFLTGAGGWLQTAFFGYTGLRINDTAVRMPAPKLPELAAHVALRGVAYRGQRLDIRYDTATLTVTLQSQPTAALVDARATAPPAPRAYAHPCQMLPDSKEAAEVRRARCAAAVAAAAASAHAPSALALHPSRAPLSARSQHGRVVLGGGEHVVAPQPLALVDAAGVVHPLAANVPLALPLQAVSIVVMAA